MTITPEMQAKISAYLEAVAVQTRGRPEPARRELLREVTDMFFTGPAAHNPRAKSFMDKVRDFFAP